MKKVTFMLFAFLSMTIGFAQTETLAEWTPVTVLATDSYGVSPFTASTTADNLVIGGLTRGSGIGTTSGTPAANAWGGTGFSATSAVEAVDENEFVTFTITADTGYTFSIESIEPYNIRRSAAGPTTGQWQYQVDSGTFTDIGSAITWGTTTSNSGNNQTAIDLSGISDLQDIEADTTVTFRLLLWGASGTGGTWYFNGHNNATNKTLTVLGSVEEESSTPTLGCEIAVTISWEDYADVTNWRLLDANGNVAIQGGVDWDDEFYDYNSSSTKTHIVANPPYTLEITIDDWMEYCDNIIDYSVTVGGVQDISGTVSVVCDDVITQTFTVGDCPDCFAPANLFASDLTFTSAELSWTGTSGLYDIEWGLQGFTQGTGTAVNNLTTTTYLLDGVLVIETYYDFYVRQNCGTDGLSTWAGPYTFYTGSNYCGVSTDWTSDYISAFSTTGAIQNVSYTATSQPAGSYANETTQVIQQAQGLSVDFSSTFVGGSNAIKIWVDVNNDFIFDDVTEVVFYEASTAATKTGTVTVPVDLPVGEYRVRVRGQFGSTANPPACGNVPYGSTIDFTLSVVAEIDPCPETITPVFTQVSAICVGDSLAPLPTTSTNGITGTWSPALDNTQTTTYTFTPDAEQCAEEVEMTITVTPNVIPMFTGMVSEICAGDDLEPLPMVSNQGIAGTWSPALNNMETTTYEFTPNAGQCAVSVSMTIVVNTVAPPTTVSPQTMTEGQTVAEIVFIDVTGTLTWYSDEDLTTEVEETFVLEEGTYTFWVTQTIGDCTSEATQVEVEVTLSTNGFDLASFRAYPNPVKDFFTVSYNKEITNVTVVNMLGQTVFAKTVNATDTQIDMTSLPTGNYFVKVTTEGAVKTVKVVKQ